MWVGVLGWQQVWVYYAERGVCFFGDRAFGQVLKLLCIVLDICCQQHGALILIPILAIPLFSTHLLPSPPLPSLLHRSVCCM